MDVTTSQQITLVVTNGTRLEGRSTSSHVFSRDGGSLGSGPSDDWLLQDRAGRIRPGHAQIQFIDGRFCLVDRSGHTFVNRATLPLGRDRRVALRDGDELLIGEYRLRAYLGDRHAGRGDDASLVALLDEGYEILEGETPRPLTASRDNPLAALGEPETPSFQRDDPLEALASAGAPPRSPLFDTLNARAEPPSNAGYGPDAPTSRRHEERDVRERDVREHDVRKRDARERLLDDLERSVGEHLEERWKDGEGGRADHVGADPLLRALGADLSFRDSEEQHAFLEEAGHALRAAIEGLQGLHAAQSGSRYRLRERHLQPIEDNPLRLGQPYQETLSTLFSAQRSPVHLAAPAAVSECLTQQSQHLAAVEEAIGVALQSILDAFAPQALLRRFHAYRGASQRIDDESGWAWDMYRHYYQELNSGRQQGFEKLFWEVFEQAYDQSLRRQQREEV